MWGNDVVLPFCLIGTWWSRRPGLLWFDLKLYASGLVLVITTTPQNTRLHRFFYGISARIAKNVLELFGAQKKGFFLYFL